MRSGRSHKSEGGKEVNKPENQHLEKKPSMTWFWVGYREHGAEESRIWTASETDLGNKKIMNFGQVGVSLKYSRKKHQTNSWVCEATYSAEVRM